MEGEGAEREAVEKGSSECSAVCRFVCRALLLLSALSAGALDSLIGF